MNMMLARLNVKRTSSPPKALTEIMSQLPTNEVDVERSGFTSIPPEQILEAIQQNIEETPLVDATVLPTDKLTTPVLEELNKLKKELGGSPIFGSNTPTLDNKDARRKFLGIPMTAVKDWFRMALNKGWYPRFFWKAVSKLFNITEENKMSQYEEAHTRIQRFGMLIANKERFMQILKDGDTKRYDELCSITGLAWHPTQNGVGTERMYVEFIEQFLTKYFEKAKQEGPAALIEYFKAFEGVCFEDRARHLEEYAKKHPLIELTEAEKQVEEVVDYDGKTPIETVYDKELMAFGVAQTQKGESVTPTAFFEYLFKKGIFNTEFAISAASDSERAKPTEEGYRIWAQKQVDLDIMEDDPADLKPTSPKLK
jgi:hypothetical protein